MSKETFKTMIGGQALIEGIMMRGPEKDAIVVRTPEGLKTEISDRKIHPKTSPLSWPFLRGPVNFFDAQYTGIKALMKSADLNPEAAAEDSSKFDKWLEEKLSNKKNQDALMTVLVCISLLFSVGLFFVLPMLLGAVFEIWVKNIFALNLIEGLIRVVILVGYMLLASLPKDMQRVFAYHGAEHKTICCYEAGLPLSVENVRKQSRFHPRCGTSFLLIVVLLSILLFSVVSTGLYGMIPWLNGIRGTIGCKLIMMAVKLLLLPVIVSIAYEINRLVGRHDNWFTKLLTAPGLWMQRITTKEPDDDMIEVGITAVEAVLPSEKGADQW